MSKQNNGQFDFKDVHTFEKRSSESKRIRSKYSDRIPVICEVAKRDRSTLKLDKNKYLVPEDLTVGQFIYVIRKRVKLSPEQALFMFIDNTLMPTNQLMKDMFKHHKDNDGFLYVLTATESSFGACV